MSPTAIPQFPLAVTGAQQAPYLLVIVVIIIAALLWVIWDFCNSGGR